MESSKYQLAGWLAISQAVVLPLAYILKSLQIYLGISPFGYDGPKFGPGDLLIITYTCFFIYTFSMFRNLLNERYNVHSIDLLIIIAILLSIVSLIFSFLVQSIPMIFGGLTDYAFRTIYLAYTAILIIAAGVVQILISVKLLMVKKSLNDLFNAFAYVTLATGILEVSVVLAPLAVLVLIPVWCVMLGMIFLREKEEAEFV
ncbi:MAG: hypothetical protein JSU85_14945 [Candidatus Zixiibacteriota bacterium]|nr:MAG: hypothetical protein JSU85_14945 [candidate division Zixibacteria bacterium]